MLLGWRCPVCGAQGAVPCDACIAAMEPADPIAPIAGVDRCIALLAYRGPARELVARAKYRNQRAGLRWLAEGIAELVRDPVDVVTWAPANPSHVRARGFDHGRLLAVAVAGRLQVPVEPLLRRDRGTPLTGMSKVARVAGPPLRARTFPLVGRTVLVVDDVVTTGATMAAAAAALRGAGAASVFGLAAAHTQNRPQNRPLSLPSPAAGGVPSANGSDVGLWLQADASRRQNGPRKAAPQLLGGC